MLSPGWGPPEAVKDWPGLQSLGTAERGLAGGRGGNPDRAIWGRGIIIITLASAEGLPVCNPLPCCLPARHTCPLRRWVGRGMCLSHRRRLRPPGGSWLRPYRVRSRGGLRRVWVQGFSYFAPLGHLSLPKAVTPPRHRRRPCTVWLQPTSAFWFLHPLLNSWLHPHQLRRIFKAWSQDQQLRWHHLNLLEMPVPGPQPRSAASEAQRLGRALCILTSSGCSEAPTSLMTSGPGSLLHPNLADNTSSSQFGSLAWDHHSYLPFQASAAGLEGMSWVQGTQMNEAHPGWTQRAQLAVSLSISKQRFGRGGWRPWTMQGAVQPRTAARPLLWVLQKSSGCGGKEQRTGRGDTEATHGAQMSCHNPHMLSCSVVNFASRRRPICREAG